MDKEKLPVKRQFFLFVKEKSTGFIEKQRVSLMSIFKK
ncbi:hypothetical protein bcere0024_08140 [Bacillus cereus Rock4-18]|nr:hypothetical protein bcere0024_08140 [Bacillus cereus Rock4-18]